MISTTQRASPAMSARTAGALAAVVTVLIWTGFIVVARAFADPSRAPTLTPFDIVYIRLIGAGLVLLPVGWVLTRRERQSQVQAGQVPVAGSFLGFSPLPLKLTVQCGFFGGLLYAMLAYSGFM